MMMIDPACCIACGSKNIKAGRIRFLIDIKKDKHAIWHCIDCKRAWTPEVSRIARRVILLK
jgi:hypothetical protein